MFPGYFALYRILEQSRPTGLLRSLSNYDLLRTSFYNFGDGSHLQAKPGSFYGILQMFAAVHVFLFRKA